VHLVDKISKMRRAAMALTEELGREPDDEELAMELGVPVNKIAHLKSVSIRPASSTPRSAKTVIPPRSAKSSATKTP